MIEQESTEQSQALVPVVTREQSIALWNEFSQFVRQQLVAGEDYIEIQGRKVLSKSGAEKVANFYGLVPTFFVSQRTENWAEGLFHYEVVCSLNARRSGDLVAQGMGSCNNRERNYVRQDPPTIVNTILKMAQKRAYVAAVLAATRASGIFTQDLDDVPQIAQNGASHAGPPSRPAQQHAVNQPAGALGGASASQINYIYQLGKDMGWSVEQIDEASVGIFRNKVAALSKKDASDYIGMLKSRSVPYQFGEDPSDMGEGGWEETEG